MTKSQMMSSNTDIKYRQQAQIAFANGETRMGETINFSPDAKTLDLRYEGNVSDQSVSTHELAYVAFRDIQSGLPVIVDRCRMSRYWVTCCNERVILVLADNHRIANGEGFYGFTENRKDLYASYFFYPQGVRQIDPVECPNPDPIVDLEALLHLSESDGAWDAVSVGKNFGYDDFDLFEEADVTEVLDGFCEDTKADPVEKQEIHIHDFNGVEISALIRRFQRELVLATTGQTDDAEDTLRNVNLVMLLSAILKEAHQNDASEIRIEPSSQIGQSNLRYMTDRVEIWSVPLPNAVRDELLGLFKMFAKVKGNDPTQSDYSFQWKIDRDPVSIHVLSVPFVNSCEHVVIWISGSLNPGP
ncbi:MAG: hypothetical protein KDC35_03910 [Acidobacteria bacterium]|nr:hypothetical protein [Acidobacteriota bacterium]